MIILFIENELSLFIFYEVPVIVGITELEWVQKLKNGVLKYPYF